MQPTLSPTEDHNEPAHVAVEQPATLCEAAAFPPPLTGSTHQHTTGLRNNSSRVAIAPAGFFSFAAPAVPIVAPSAAVAPGLQVTPATPGPGTVLAQEPGQPHAPHPPAQPALPAVINVYPSMYNGAQALMQQLSSSCRPPLAAGNNSVRAPVQPTAQAHVATEVVEAQPAAAHVEHPPATASAPVVSPKSPSSTGSAKKGPPSVDASGTKPAPTVASADTPAAAGAAAAAAATAPAVATPTIQNREASMSIEEAEEVARTVLSQSGAIPLAHTVWRGASPAVGFPKAAAAAKKSEEARKVVEAAKGTEAKASGDAKAPEEAAPKAAEEAPNAAKAAEEVKATEAEATAAAAAATASEPPIADTPAAFHDPRVVAMPLKDYPPAPKEVLRRALTAFYQKHKPSEVAKVDTAVAQDMTRENVFEALELLYDESPADFVNTDGSVPLCMMATAPTAEYIGGAKSKSASPALAAVPAVVPLPDGDTVPVCEYPSAATELMRQCLTAFYQKHRPGDVTKVESALANHLTRDTMFTALEGKYDENPAIYLPPGADPASAAALGSRAPAEAPGSAATEEPAVAEEPAAAEEAALAAVPAVNPALALELAEVFVVAYPLEAKEALREGLTAFYQKHHSEDNEAVDAALSKQMTRAKLFGSLEQTYGESPAVFLKGVAPTPAAEAAVEPAPHATGAAIPASMPAIEKMRSVAAAPAVNPAMEPELENVNVVNYPEEAKEALRAGLTAFYQKHKPEDASKVDTALSKEMARGKMFGALEKKYGESPAVFLDATRGRSSVAPLAGASTGASTFAESQAAGTAISASVPEKTPSRSALLLPVAGVNPAMAPELVNVKVVDYPPEAKEALRHALTAFYQKHKPDDISKVNTALSKEMTRGKMFGALEKKYGESPAVFLAPAALPPMAPRGRQPAVAVSSGSATPDIKIDLRSPSKEGHQLTTGAEKVLRILSQALAESGRRSTQVTPRHPSSTPLRNPPEVAEEIEKAAEPTPLDGPALLNVSVKDYPPPAKEMLRQCLKAFYQKHRPEDLDKVDAALSKDMPRGAIFDALEKKYGQTPADFLSAYVAPPPVPTAEAPAVEQAAVEENLHPIYMPAVEAMNANEYPPQARDALETVLMAFYQKHRPEDLEKVQSAISKSLTRGVIFDSLAGKYGENPQALLEEMVPRQLPTSDDEVMSEYTVLHSDCEDSVPAGGLQDVFGEELWFAIVDTPVGKYPPEAKDALRHALTAFYQKHKPSDVKRVKSALRKNMTRDHLFSVIATKYGESPEIYLQPPYVPRHDTAGMVSSRRSSMVAADVTRLSSDLAADLTVAGGGVAMATNGAMTCPAMAPGAPRAMASIVVIAGERAPLPVKDRSAAGVIEMPGMSGRQDVSGRYGDASQCIKQQVAANPQLAGRRPEDPTPLADGPGDEGPALWAKLAAPPGRSSAVGSYRPAGIRPAVLNPPGMADGPWPNVHSPRLPNSPLVPPSVERASQRGSLVRHSLSPVAPPPAGVAPQQGARVRAGVAIGPLERLASQAEAVDGFAVRDGPLFASSDRFRAEPPSTGAPAATESSTGPAYASLLRSRAGDPHFFDRPLAAGESDAPHEAAIAEAAFTPPGHLLTALSGGGRGPADPLVDPASLGDLRHGSQASATARRVSGGMHDTAATPLPDPYSAGATVAGNQAVRPAGGAFVQPPIHPAAAVSSSFLVRQTTGNAPQGSGSARKTYHPQLQRSTVLTGSTLGAGGLRATHSSATGQAQNTEFRRRSTSQPIPGSHPMMAAQPDGGANVSAMQRAEDPAAGSYVDPTRLAPALWDSRAQADAAADAAAAPPVGASTWDSVVRQSGAVAADRAAMLGF